jgi:hypothetical protein
MIYVITLHNTVPLVKNKINIFTGGLLKYNKYIYWGLLKYNKYIYWAVS